MKDGRLDKFLKTFSIGQEHPIVLDLDVSDGPPYSSIVLRHGDRVLVLQVMGFAEGAKPAHLVVDAHGFVRDEPAPVAAMGLVDGRTLQLFSRDGQPSGVRAHGWPAADQATFMIGD